MSGSRTAQSMRSGSLDPTLHPGPCVVLGAQGAHRRGPGPGRVVGHLQDRGGVVVRPGRQEHAAAGDLGHVPWARAHLSSPASSPPTQASSRWPRCGSRLPAGPLPGEAQLLGDPPGGVVAHPGPPLDPLQPEHLEPELADHPGGGRHDALAAGPGGAPVADLAHRRVPRVQADHAEQPPVGGVGDREGHLAALGVLPAVRPLGDELPGVVLGVGHRDRDPAGDRLVLAGLDDGRHVTLLGRAEQQGAGGQGGGSGVGHHPIQPGHLGRGRGVSRGVLRLRLRWPEGPPARNAPSDRSRRLRVPAFFDKMLRAGEGKILRKLKTISEQVNAIEDDFAAMTDAELRAMTDEFRAPPRRRRDARRPAAGGVRDGPRGRQAHPRPAALRRPDHGRRGAAPRQHRRDEDR